ncbi:MAG TPA: FAD-dependent monooxygenase [Streptosporangiaceae bacterium]|nr:FAD-dependent monooxygenase [Streptosporangiaceae bacterium]
MPVEGGRVAIVGGSIAGCAAAIALRRARCDVTIYERSSGALRDRGFGIGLPVSLRETLVSAGYIDAEMPVHRAVERLWVVPDVYPADGTPVEGGRVAFRQPLSTLVTNWGIVWRTLRAKLPDEIYRPDVAVQGIEPDADGATVVTAHGEREHVDLVVGADGYRSFVRTLVAAEPWPAYAGYVLWRGTYPQSRLTAPMPVVFDGAGVTVCFPGGHAVFYAVPDFATGDRRLNWAVYAAAPHGARFTSPTSLPPGSVRGELADRLDQILAGDFPPYWAKAVRLTRRRELSLQPIYDLAVPAYTSGRLLVAGDAGALARPHTAAGVGKALEDAHYLERACREHDTWEEVLAAYDGERRPAGNAVVELGRRLGRAQVEETPPWSSMTAEDFRTWMDTTLAGRRWRRAP